MVFWVVNVLIGLIIGVGGFCGFVVFEGYFGLWLFVGDEIVIFVICCFVMLILKGMLVWIVIEIVDVVY